MDIKKRFVQGMKRQLAAQLDRVTFESVLGAVGLQLLKRSRGVFMPIVAGFGAGLAVGAGAALLLAPMSGSELRAKISAITEKLSFWNTTDAADDDEGAEPVRAKVAKSPRVAVDGSNGRTKSQRGSDADAAT